MQDIEGVITFSVGSGDERKIIVAPEQYQQKKDQRVAKPDKEESLQNSAVSDAPAETADQPAAADTKTQEVSVKVVPDISALGEIEEYSEKPHKFEKPRDFGRERSGNNDRRDGGRGNNNGRNSGRPNNNRGGGRDFNKRGPKPVSVNVTAQTQPPVEVSNAPVVPPFPKKIRRPVMNPNIKVTDDRTIKSDTEIAGGSPKVYEYNPQRPPREIKKAKSIDELNLADVEDTEEVILKK
ncbi:hypothetical protein SDC9_173555 [bioreactor metagenome]|uniref:Uncharacterized protein n=1 Tax=bioreactor metagenome TaxID=1076179 RepID=A0A645GGP8_9ZZZZ